MRGLVRRSRLAHGVDYAPRLHEHAPCDGNGPWKERRVVSNGNASADKVAIVTAAGSGMGSRARTWSSLEPRWGERIVIEQRRREYACQ
jgi:hypothetical protein